MVVSFCAVLDEILNLIESVSGEFPSYSCKFKVNVSLAIMMNISTRSLRTLFPFISYNKARFLRTNRLLYSAFTDTNCAFTDLEHTLIKWEISPKWLHLMARTLYKLMITFSHNHSKQQIYIMSLVLLKKAAVRKIYDTKSLYNQIDSL